MKAISVIPFAALAALPAVAQQRPNVVLIVSDDQGYGGVNCYPHTDRIHTPNIDALAASGVQCMQGYTSGSLSSPTRAGLLTGKYQQSFGFYSLESPSVGGIPAEQRLVSEYLHDAGYATACIGKWHVGDYIRNHPVNRGFDKFYGFINGLHDYFDPLVGGSWDGTYTGLAFTLDGMEPAIDMDYTTYEYTDQAVDFIRSSAEAGKPFFVYLAYNAIHSPYQVPEELLQKYADDPANPTKKDRVRAMTAALDQGVGKVMQTLDSLNLRNETIVFYLSDNGGVRGVSDLSGLRGQKGSYYEGGIRVPFIASYPGVIPAGKVYDEPVISIDIVPTVLAQANVEAEGLQGTNLVPYFRGDTQDAPHETLYWSEPLNNAQRVNRNSFAIRQGKWKLVSDPKRVKACDLYDLEADPGEKHGLKERYPEKVEELYNDYLAWIGSCEPDLALGGNARLSGQALMNKYRAKLREAGRPTPPMSFGVDKAPSNDPEAAPKQKHRKQ